MLVITGATGNIGSKITMNLLKQGRKVRVIGRDATRLQPFVDEGAQATVGDLTNGIDESTGDLAPALAWVARDEENGEGDAPWPTHYPKMPGEPPRVQPSKKREENWQ